MFTLQGTSYDNGEEIPTKYAHASVVGGHNISPGFDWTDPPTSTKSFALSIIDPHPVAKNWVHWFLVNIPFKERTIREGSSMTSTLPSGSREMMNSYGELGYGGPAPPPGSGSHPYVTTLYALNVESIALGKNASLREFLRSIEGKVIAEAGMTGYFERK